MGTLSGDSKMKQWFICACYYLGQISDVMNREGLLEFLFGDNVGFLSSN